MTDQPQTAYLIQDYAIYPFKVDPEVVPTSDVYVWCEFMREKPIWESPKNNTSSGKFYLEVGFSSQYPFKHDAVAWSVSEAVDALKPRHESLIRGLQTLGRSTEYFDTLDYTKILQEALVAAGEAPAKETYISPFTGRRV